MSLLTGNGPFDRSRRSRSLYLHSMYSILTHPEYPFASSRRLLGPLANSSDMHGFALIGATMGSIHLFLVFELGVLKACVKLTVTTPATVLLSTLL